MVFAGLQLAQALALFTAAGAIAVALYLLRLRQRRVAVPFLALWEPLLARPASTRLFARLRRLLSLLVALLLIALLTAALADPRPAEGSRQLRHTLIVVDAGLTMRATDVRPTRLAVALAHARDRIADAGPHHRMLVAQLDAALTPLSSLTSERDELERALAQVRPTDSMTNAEAAHRFALAVLENRHGARVLVLSDRAAAPDGKLAGALRRAGIAVETLRVGRSDANFAITEFALRRYPLDKTRAELFFEVRNASRAPGKLELTLLGDGAPVAVETIDVPAGASVRRIFEDVGGVDRTLEARIRPLAGSRDELPADDHAYAVVPPRRRARVLCVSQDNRYLEAALLLDEYLAVDVVAPASYASADGYDAVIYDRFLPPRAPGVDAVYLRPAPSAGRAAPLDVTGEVERPTFERIQRDHPVLRWTALRDVNVSRALALRPAPGDQVLAADARTPLIVAGERDGHRFVALGFDVRESDLPLRVAWPLLILNAIDWFQGEDVGYLAPLEVGDAVRVALPAGVTRARVTQPDGVARTLDAVDGSVVTSARRAGFVRIATGTTEQVVAVNRAPDASGDIAPAPGAVADAGSRAQASPRRDAGGQPAWAWLLLLACLLACLEWAAYHRRWSV